VSRVVVLGAGLTGLSSAWHLARRDVAATVLERDERPGGARAAPSRSTVFTST